MNMLRENMRLIAECSQQLVRLGENLWGKEQKLDKVEPLDVPTMTTDFVKEYGLPCPEGYQFRDENGNVINATKIVLEKREYPNTYEECCDVLSISSYYKLRCYTYKHGYNEYATSNQLCSLQDKLNILGKLIICRNTYWKLYGDEMGLGKPWEPDWEDENQEKYIIGSWLGTIQGLEENFVSHPLAFPTKEMRDAFKENFDPDIEFCKELL